MKTDCLAMKTFQRTIKANVLYSTRDTGRRVWLMWTSEGR